MTVRSPCGSSAFLGLAQRAGLALAYTGEALELPQLFAPARLSPRPLCTWTQPSSSPDSAELQKAGVTTQVLEGLPRPLH